MTITIATYNLWGQGEPWRYQAERGIVRGAAPGSRALGLRPVEGVWSRRRPLVATALRRAAVDLVGLQEVPVAGPGLPDGAAELSGALGLRRVEPPAAADGLGLLSRWPIRDLQAVALPAAGRDGDQPQPALHAVIDAPGGPLDLIVCHLMPHDEASRLAAVERLLAYLAQLPPARPRLLVGDLNAEPNTATLRHLTGAGPAAGGGQALRDAWSLVTPAAAGATMPSHAPVSRIDYILVGQGWRVLGVERLGDEPDADGFYPSDHLGVAASLQRSDT